MQRKNLRAEQELVGILTWILGLADSDVANAFSLQTEV